MRLPSLLMSTGLFWGLLGSGALAQAPARLPIQGYLADSDGEAIEGTTEMAIAVYDTATGGAALFEEIQSVEVSRGRFTVYAGDERVFDLSFFRDYGALYLEVSVGGEALEPRFSVGTVGYAAYAEYAGDATTLGGTGAAGFAASGHGHTAYAVGDHTHANYSIDDHTHANYSADDHVHGEYAASAHSHLWSDLSSVPVDIADGDQNTTYTAGDGLQMSGTSLSTDGTVARLSSGATFSGDLRTTGELGWSTTRTFKKWLGPFGLIYRAGALTLHPTFGAYVGGGTSFSAYSPVHLPAGARITAFDCYAYDNDAAVDATSVTIDFRGVDHTTGTGAIVAAISESTSGQPGLEVWSRTPSHTVDPDRAYHFSISWFVSLHGGDPYFRGCLVTYQTDELTY